ncbi:hypothetical protein MATL_G00142430 [Megalops atlanticus]|uniref:Intestinal mucin-like protein n=1 Tax=Megalops atlanticus TaxID=7932 RepID=A0A9D3PUJ0_MEGAT|nr:hypothetical protein MATL_G00142430 [Megalops atlanticus]
MCKYNGTSFPKGSEIYNVTDHAGFCFTAFCNETCGIVKNFGPCYTTYHPPKKSGESWRYDNCTIATCYSGSVTLKPVQCDPVKPIVCENNLPPVKVYDESGCCYQYQCQCVCYGWGDPHYVTFDGTYYAFQGDCSYVLVKEIHPKYNFSVVIDNYMCDSPDGLSCPQSLTVYYKSYEIFMTQKDIHGVFTNLIYINGKHIIPAYENKDFRITDNGIETLLVIPAIDARVSFRGLMFSIYLPYSKFYNNTEGQCGTCDNNRKDDCRLPSGKIDKSCPDMANHWKVPGKNDSHCVQQPTPSPSPKPCQTQPAICKLIEHEIFEECHKVIPYEPFVIACEFDVCHMPGSHIGCTSVQMYAAACSMAGICIDWRNSTGGECDYTCEEPKVYEPCVPLTEPTCDVRYNTKFIKEVNQFSMMGNILTEGCFCPPGTTLLSSDSDECVPYDCEYCLLPNGKPKRAGETWRSDCHNCVCDINTLHVLCTPVDCPPPPPVTCDEVGQIAVNETQHCCQKTVCACQNNSCPAKHTCEPGYTLEVTMGACCPNYMCLPKDVCVSNGTEYKPGDSVPKAKCEECICSHEVDSNTRLHKINCTPTPCDTHCPLGFEYQPVPGQCCGKCVHNSCVIILPDQTVHTVKPGSTWSPPGNKCVKYECIKIENQLISMESKIVCPEFKPEDCIPGTEVIAPDGCCRVCIKKWQPCNVTRTVSHLVSDGCRSVKPVEMTTCAGSCGTSSMYSFQAKMVQRSCSCCQETAVSKKQVEMVCPNGSKFRHSYVYIEQCGCLQTKCTTEETTAKAQAQAQAQEKAKLHRRRR